MSGKGHGIYDKIGAPGVIAARITVGGHIDEGLYAKIKNGEYVDFSKLVPRDKIIAEEDQHLEMIIQGGRTFYIPVSEGANINGFAKWEQAFRVYANIYTKENPQRSSEMIEYNHVIHTISSTYVWDNVYQYDKEFRMHMARNPEHSWAIILQQAWSLRLKDKLHITGENRSTAGGHRTTEVMNYVGSATGENVNLSQDADMTTSVHTVSNLVIPS